MKNLIYLLTIVLAISSCGSDNKSTGNLTINGSIEGLRVGKVLLQKIEDSTLHTVDSVSLNGESSFTLSGIIDEPQIMYLHLDIKDGTEYDDRLIFFAEDTVMTLYSKLNNFEKEAVITGSKNQEILSEYNGNKSKLNQVYTELIKRSMLIDNDEKATPEEIERLNEDYDKYLRKKVLYAVNFAQRFKDKEVAPYILITDAFDANPILLDSTFQKMPKKIQTSRYGKQLSELIEKSKEENL